MASSEIPRRYMHALEDLHESLEAEPPQRGRRCPEVGHRLGLGQHGGAGGRGGLAEHRARQPRARSRLETTRCLQRMVQA